MAFGGGTFLVQNKTLPGSYINFVSWRVGPGRLAWAKFIAPRRAARRAGAARAGLWSFKPLALIYKAPAAIYLIATKEPQAASAGSFSG